MVSLTAPIKKAKTAKCLLFSDQKKDRFLLANELKEKVFLK